MAVGEPSVRWLGCPRSATCLFKCVSQLSSAPHCTSSTPLPLARSWVVDDRHVRQTHLFENPFTSVSLESKLPRQHEFPYLLGLLVWCKWPWMNTIRIQEIFDFLKELVKSKLAEGYYIPIGSPIETSTRRNLCSEGISNDPSELSSWHHDNWHFGIWSKASTLQPLHEGDVMWHARKAIPNSEPSISNMSTPSQEWQVNRFGSKVLWIIISKPQLWAMPKICLPVVLLCRHAETQFRHLLRRTHCHLAHVFQTKQGASLFLLTSSY